MLDAAGAADCVLVCHCAPVACRAAARRRAPRAGPRRVLHVAGAADHAAAARAHRATPSTPSCPTYEGWAKANRHYWARDFRGYLEFFFDRCFTEPHSTKQIEDSVAWALETTPETLALTIDAPGPGPRRDRRPARRGCPARCSSSRATRTGSSRPTAGRRSPRPPAPSWSSSRTSATAPTPAIRCASTELLRDFAERAYGRATGAAPWRRAVGRPRRALYRLLADRPRSRLARRRHRARAARAAPRPGDRLAGAGPGHARARGVRRADPPRERAAGQRVAPHRRRVARARAQRLPGVAAHGRDPAGQLHGLPTTSVRDDPYDLWIGDEAWELDYYLHENPELKTRPTPS